MNEPDIEALIKEWSLMPEYHRLPFEKLAARLRELLPGAEMSRVRDAIQIEEPGPCGIALLVTPEALEIRLPFTLWEHSHFGRPTSRLFKRLATTRLSERRLLNQLELARAAYREEFATCQYCQRLVHKSHRFRETVCHGCASDHLGVIF